MITLKQQETEVYWKCPVCGLELTFEEVCQSEGHIHENPELLKENK